MPERPVSRATVPLRRELVRRDPAKQAAIATEISAFEKFYPAEAYHQNYVKLNPKNPYVRNVSIPRLIEAGFKE